MVQNEAIKKDEIEPKSFEDLIKEVHDLGICGQCGGCVSFCSADKIEAIGMDVDGPPHYINKDNCLHCGICYLICPQIHVLDKELHLRFKWKPPIGNWIYVNSAQTTINEIMKNATDGGVVTSILLYLLENNLIDGALISKKITPFSREPFLATTKKEIIEGAGSKFDLSNQPLELSKYTTFTSTVKGLRSIIDEDLSNIAIVAVPCQIHTIRKMQEIGILPAHVIKYTFGLFCFQNLLFKDRNLMEQKFNILFNEIEKMNVKEDFIFLLKDKNPVHVSFQELEPFIRPSCQVCDDFANVYSDISFGGLGSDENFTTCLIRTPTGDKIYQGALKQGYIHENPDYNNSIKKSIIMSKIISYAKMKLKRSEKEFKKLVNK
ncbi:MAG: Coenzyme F420 hydrogenase/dehydrogenase, beta subunit C-terminal domain [Candidatus Helarchaeota archaeon]